MLGISRMDKKVWAFQSLWHMIPTTPHPLTPALGPFPILSKPIHSGRWTVWTLSMDGLDKQFFFAGSDDHSCGTPPHIHAGPSSVLPHSHGNSSILLSLAGGGLPQGHSLYNSNRSQKYLPLEIIIILIQLLRTPKTSTLKQTQRRQSGLWS